MKYIAAEAMRDVLDWCGRTLGPVDVVSDHSKDHPGHVSTTCRLKTSTGFCFLKVHQGRESWTSEVHAYEQWAAALGPLAPRLLAVRDSELPVLVVSELPGRILDVAAMTPAQGQAIWRAGGKALSVLHGLGPGKAFGHCARDGSPAQDAPTDAIAHVSGSFRGWMERADKAALLTADEQATVKAALALIPSFAGERPVACHYDYGPVNWLVSGDSDLTGIIDFEKSHWDVRVADLTRDPDWSWVRRPDFYQALLEGYGCAFTPGQEQQLLVAHADFALAAIVWGHEAEYFGFEREGRDALAKLAPLVR